MAIFPTATRKSALITGISLIVFIEALQALEHFEVLPVGAHAFDKDRQLLEAEPDCLGAGLTIMSAGQEASTLGDQA